MPESNQSESSRELSLTDLWDVLVDKEDITITVDINRVEYIRKGLAKIKHREKEKMGEFADGSMRFNSYPLPQTKDEKAQEICRLRLVLHTQEGFDVHKLQINDVNDLG